MSTELEIDLRARAKAIAKEANECCNRSDGFEEEIEDLALQHLANAVHAERARCANIAIAIDSGRGNEKEIAKAIMLPLSSGEQTP